jgi:hypothetical protein
MPTITNRLDKDTNGRLQRRLARCGETPSEFVRAAVAGRLAAAPALETPYDAWVRLRNAG